MSSDLVNFTASKSLGYCDDDVCEATGCVMFARQRDTESSGGNIACKADGDYFQISRDKVV